MKLTGPGIPTRDPSNASAHLAAKLSKEDFGAQAALASSGELQPS
jgi:hypothetical protein